MNIPEQKQSTNQDSKIGKKEQVNLGKIIERPISQQKDNVSNNSNSKKSQLQSPEIVVTPIPIRIPESREELNRRQLFQEMEFNFSEESKSNKAKEEQNKNSNKKEQEREENQIQEISINQNNPKPNSVAGVTFLLAKTCIGSVIFTLAIRAKQVSLLWLLVFILLSCLLNVWSILRMVQSAKNISERDYSDVAKKLLGYTPSLILNIILMLYTFSTLISYSTLIYALVGRFIKGVFYLNNDKYPTFNEFKEEIWDVAKYKFPILFGMALLLALISLQRDLRKLNFVGYFGMAANFYIILVVAIECNKYYENYKGNPEINWTNIKPAFGKDLEFFHSMSTLIHAFSCHTSVFPTFESFHNCPNDTGLMTKAVIYSSAIEFVYFILSVVPSFLTNPLYPEDVILYREPLDKNSKDIPMNIAKIALALGLFFSIPLYYNSFRQCFVKTFCKGELSCKVNIILTSISFALTALVCGLYDKILNYISYVGGFIDVFFCYLFPALMYIQSSGKGFTHWSSLLEISLAVILIGVGFTSGILTIISDVNGD